MQQNNYIEAEEAYRRALLLAPDNNKMCNLGICLMKQGRIVEAKETLRRVKPAVADGPRGIDSHLKAYERAQQMLRDLESEMMNRGGEDRVQQSKLFDAFLGNSAIWQPQPCKENNHPISKGSSSSSTKIQDDGFGDENSNSNSNIMRANQIHHNNMVMMNSHNSDGFADENANSNVMRMNQIHHKNMMMNSLNSAAQPFYSSKFGKGEVLPESLKRSRSGNMSNLEQKTASIEPENKVRKQSISPDKSWADFLPDSKDFEDAIIAAVLGFDQEKKGDDIGQKKVDKRLKVFQDITHSLSPRA